MADSRLPKRGKMPAQLSAYGQEYDGWHEATHDTKKALLL